MGIKLKTWANDVRKERSIFWIFWTTKWPKTSKKALFQICYGHSITQTNPTQMPSWSQAWNFEHGNLLCFIYFSRAVIILFSTGLSKSAFSTHSFGKLGYRVSAFFMLSVCWCSNNCPRGKLPPGKLPPRQLPPGLLPPEQLPRRKIVPRTIAPEENCLLDNFP